MSSCSHERVMDAGLGLHIISFRWVLFLLYGKHGQWFEFLNTFKSLQILFGILLRFHVWINLLFVPHFPNTCVSRYWALLMHLLCMISRSLIPLFGLSTNLNQGPSSWSSSLPMVRQKAIIHFNGHGNLGNDKLWDLKVCLWLQYFFCHYSHIISRPLCGYAWKMPSFTICFHAYY